MPEFIWQYAGPRRQVVAIVREEDRLAAEHARLMALIAYEQNANMAAQARFNAGCGHGGGLLGGILGSVLA